ncbi:hypothetical protein GTO89_08155 [Heliobacterium gestii]|uniref:Uncharacterized protein n=1 Tax=Heliomicrobium gestii TaxID=2699 RepID=A0A845LJF5_HELGE|nr:glycosyltransferase family 9 protein [Heliomicrobium gestii]MBM7866714.1 hypothetical protein [Heliomicrobium gestii]MZP43006.1 hypothetical protein [Heliomicrobium gestii]
MNESTEKWCLLIRAVSFQQIDKIVPALVQEYPGMKLAILTHAHGRDMAAGYGEVDEVLVYPEVGSFDPAKVPEAVRSRRWDTVVAPVANVSGSGFYNVLRFSLAIPARQHVQINLPGQLSPLTSAGLMATGARNGAFTLLAALAAALLWLPWLIVFSLMALFVPHKREELGPG